MANPGRLAAAATAARRALAIRAGAAAVASATAWYTTSHTSAHAQPATAWHTLTPSASSSIPKSADKAYQSGLELLVYNISHADLVLQLREEPIDAATASDQPMRSFLARPRFNAFMPVSEAINRHIDRHHAAGRKMEAIFCRTQHRVEYPAGIDLEHDGAPGAVEVAVPNSSGSSHDDAAAEAVAAAAADAAPPQSPSASWALFHLKGPSKGKLSMGRDLAEEGSTAPRIIGVYLPLLAVVIPAWLRAIKRRMLQLERGAEAEVEPRKVLVLVSGAGQPRDAKANPADNSTEGTGFLIKRFIELVYPGIEVVHIPSAYGIFRYDDNVRFVKEQVLPVIEARRADVVAEHHEEWRERLRVTVCLADGAPARISALNAACRSYRPDYLHVWRTKTFWDTQTLCEEDVESHAFKKLEMRPAVGRSQLSEAERKVVEEMQNYRRQLEAVQEADSHELSTFWLRKTGTAVLAVLLTRKPDGAYSYWRGMNVEVSMPTGTLCAERNAISNALASDQSCRRADMLALGVLCVNLDAKNDERVHANADDELSGSSVNPLDPCGACMEWLRKIAEVNPDFKVLTFTSPSCEQVFVTSIGDYG